MYNTLKATQLAKLSLVQLQEIEKRQANLLRNESVINKLSDKGESVREFLKRVRAEIAHRQSMVELENSMKHLKLTGDMDYVLHLCSIEKEPQSPRFKPSSTLNTPMKSNPKGKILKVLQEPKHSNKPTKMVDLGESLRLLSAQAKRVEDGEANRRLERRLQKIFDEEKTDSEVDSTTAESDTDSD